MKFPFFKQLDSMDCGPSCLRMVAKFYGKSFTLQALRSKAFISKSGVSMLGISDAAESIGFRTRGYRLTWEQLRDEVPLPCIVHWNQRHFVVGYWIRKRWMIQARSKVSESLCILEADDISKEVGNENSKLYKSCNVIGTPTFFVNGYLLPNQYDIDDIKYFSEVFSRKEEIVVSGN